MTRAAPTATTPAAVRSASGPVGAGGTLGGLSSRRTTETGRPDVRISKRTYELEQLGLQHAAWKLPTSAFGPCSWANVTRGGWYVTVITGPQERCRITLPSAMRASGFELRPGMGCASVCRQQRSSLDVDTNTIALADNAVRQGVGGANGTPV